MTIQNSVGSMLSALQDVAEWSEDIIEHAVAVPVDVSRSGQRGRHRKVIDTNILETSLQLQGPTHLTSVFQCSARTIRRRALEHGLTQPSPPVYVTYEDPDSGESLRVYHSFLSTYLILQSI